MSSTNNLMERIVEQDNCRRAYKRVMANKGAPGMDSITIEDFPNHLRARWPYIRQQLLDGTYKPRPVRRVPIPKQDGGTRNLGIPTLTDRFIQQVILQILTPIFDPTFSDSSFGFRPRRSAHAAVEKARQHIEKGYTTVVDLDVEKFFDTVNHDRLMARLAQRIEDKRLLRLIRRYFAAGILANGIYVRTPMGTPQGGPLSPLLANVVLDELDRELEWRGHRFCRYADDCNIYVRTPRAGERVMQSMTRFIEKKLKLRVNQEKSAVGKPNTRRFLGFSFYWRKGKTRIAVAQKTKQRLTRTIRELTSRRRNNRTLDDRIRLINQYLTGWIAYFSLADAASFLEEVDGTLKRRLRMGIWKQWKTVRTRYRNLRNLGLSHTNALKYANTRKGSWRIAGSAILTTTLTNRYFKERGLLPLVETYQRLRAC